VKDLTPEKRNSPQAFQPAGCSGGLFGIDWGGHSRGPSLTPVPGTACVRRIRLYLYQSAHTHGLFARDVPDSPDQRFLENSA